MFPRAMASRSVTFAPSPFETNVSTHKEEDADGKTVGYSAGVVALGGSLLENVTRYLGGPKKESIPDDVEALAMLLQWQHWAPTAPDTAPCRPVDAFKSDKHAAKVAKRARSDKKRESGRSDTGDPKGWVDPMVAPSRPRILVCGNCQRYGSLVVQGEEGDGTRESESAGGRAKKAGETADERTLVLALPAFFRTATVVVANPCTLQTWNIALE